MTDDQLVDISLARLGFRSWIKSGWCPHYGNDSYYVNWDRWRGLKQRLGIKHVSSEPQETWATKIEYWREDGTTIFARYDGGGAWAFLVLHPDGRKAKIRENDYQSLSRYFRTGNADYVPPESSGPDVYIDGVKQGVSWGVVNLCGN
jgi:hypothetical protein